MEDLETAERIRTFNRFYTEAIGSLDEQHEGLEITLAESRVLYIVSSLESSRVNEVADQLSLDLAYTSRVLGTLEDAKLIRRSISTEDRRERVVTLTPKGDRLLDEIKNRSNQRVMSLIGHLDSDQVGELLAAMATVRALLSKEAT